MNLTREVIRSVLHRVGPDHDVPVTGDEPWADSDSPKRAAVLVPLRFVENQWEVLLSVRTGHLTTHAGQISFPGGSLEAGDAGPVDAALRETEEETGITREHVEVAGLLDRYQTVTGYLMTPVVGFLEPGFDLRPCPDEVAELFWMPMNLAVRRERYQRRSLVFRGRRRHFYAQEFEERVVWGATAAILVSFGERLKEAAGEGLNADAV